MDFDIQRFDELIHKLSTLQPREVEFLLGHNSEFLETVQRGHKVLSDVLKVHRRLSKFKDRKKLQYSDAEGIGLSFMKQKKEHEKEIIRTQLEKQNEGKIMEEKGVIFNDFRKKVKLVVPTYCDPKKFVFELERSKTCYVCKKKYTKVHFMYDQLCVDCGGINFLKRNQFCVLEGRTALLTGGRVKIGFEVGLKLLRSGCRTVVLTRFPKDAARRYSKEQDFDEWSDLLRIYQLDLRNIPRVIEFTKFFQQRFERLDILINNAAQTISRPPLFYQHLAEFESTPLDDLPSGLQKLLCENSSTPTTRGNNNNNLVDWNRNCPTRIDLQIDRPPPPSPRREEVIVGQGEEEEEGGEEEEEVMEMEMVREFPDGCLDVNRQQVDLRADNTWNSLLEDVSLQEFAEVQLINSFAPFVLFKGLVSLFKEEKRCKERKYIINVTAQEGTFSKGYKNEFHCHAKAALNMMTRTLKVDCQKYNIFINSVDTGWITSEHALSFKKRFTPPLDEVDGAARILDPIFKSENEDIVFSGLRITRLQNGDIYLSMTCN